MPRLSAADRNIAIGHIQRGNRNLLLHAPSTSTTAPFSAFGTDTHSSIPLQTVREPADLHKIVTFDCSTYVIAMTQLRRLQDTSEEDIGPDYQEPSLCCEAGIRPRRPVIVPVLEQIHRQRRLRGTKENNTQAVRAFELTGQAVSDADMLDNMNTTGRDRRDIHDVIYTPEYILFSIAIGVLSIVGTAGNIPVLVVYFRRKDKKTSNTFIKILALIDLLVCMLIMPYTLVYELHLVYSDVACRLFEYFRHFAIISSNVTVVAIAAERYFAVCHFAKRFTVKQVNCGMIVVVTISGILATPAVMIFTLVTADEVRDIECQFPHPGNATHFCHFTTSVTGPLVAYLYQGLLMLSFFISLIVIVILYAIVYSTLWKRTKLRTIQNQQIATIGNEDKSDTSGAKSAISILSADNSLSVVKGECSEVSDQKETSFVEDCKCASGSTLGTSIRNKRIGLHYRTAKMLFTCTVIYLITWVPFWFDIFGATQFLLLRYMFFLGNATNPLVYGIVNSHVRHSFLRLLHECKPSVSFMFKVDVPKSPASKGNETQ
ncbi:cholecystokinin receptor-like [Haliotis cracherodii]|uniref:cholecystokinin receptor-like n=1 Tax=Haliotis cracherodii TaxID=6455 RepID=UPI0039E74AD7